MEWYWTMTGMQQLQGAVIRDAQRLRGLLEDQGIEVIDSGLVATPGQSAAAGKRFLDQGVDLAILYHGTYVDDRTSYAFLDNCGDLPLVLAHTQGMDNIPEDFSLIDYARCWGNNSAVQVLSSLKRIRPTRQVCYVFGHMPHAAKQLRLF
jgi:hypothetical protein